MAPQRRPFEDLIRLERENLLAKHGLLPRTGQARANSGGNPNGNGGAALNGGGASALCPECAAKAAKNAGGNPNGNTQWSDAAGNPSAFVSKRAFGAGAGGEEAAENAEAEAPEGVGLGETESFRAAPKEPDYIFAPGTVIPVELVAAVRNLLEIASTPAPCSSDSSERFNEFIGLEILFPQNLFPNLMPLRATFRASDEQRMSIALRGLAVAGNKYFPKQVLCCYRGTLVSETPITCGYVGQLVGNLTGCPLVHTWWYFWLKKCPKTELKCFWL